MKAKSRIKLVVESLRAGLKNRHVGEKTICGKRLEVQIEEANV